MKTLRFNTIKLLNEQKQQKIYKAMHKKAKTPHESVGWISEERQKLRFEELTRGLSLDGKKILDFGCGLGAFCGFLQEKGISYDYTGIDLVESFIKKAAITYPEARFVKGSIFDIDEPFDYVFSSGVYAFCSKELFLESIKKSFALAKYEYRFNMLIDAKSSGFFKCSKKELNFFLAPFDSLISYKFGYLENDMTIFMGKQ